MAKYKDYHPKGYYNERSRKYRAEKKEKINALKEELGCCKCGEADFRCLDFHHRDPDQKNNTISSLYRGTWCWERIEEEISLCEVLCANCHRKEHYDRRHGRSS